ncbi:MAG: DUF72 domain-containing protein [Candidatus Thermoplasmatota archaeon]|nr:DUF72 domain-containing protein [Candidatus Thermoplasmatota archaeon]
MGDIRLGCSGWDYEEWIGPFYKSRARSKLSSYGRVFETVEINSTFYRPPTEGMVLGWSRYSPEGFLFAAKVPQTVTHDRLLKVESGADEHLESFCQLMRPLLDSGKLGVLLLQLPPRLRFSEERTRRFFETIPLEYRFAIEFRNESWMCPEAFDLLREYKVAYTVVDEPLLPPDVHITSTIAYIRWHGHGTDPWYNYRYGREDLESWVPRLKDMADGSSTVYGYFNNHFHGYAPENCLEVLEMLGALTPAQSRALKRVREYRKGIRRAARVKVRSTTLEEFSGEGDSLDLLLERLSSRPRIERARKIAKGGLTVRSEGGAMTARVGRYSVTIDMGGKLLRHDCEDWRKNLPEGLLCKHVSAVFIALPTELSLGVLRDLLDSRKEWSLEG